jgi:hypothetical protein
MQMQQQQLAAQKEQEKQQSKAPGVVKKAAAHPLAYGIPTGLALGGAAYYGATHGENEKIRKKIKKLRASKSKSRLAQINRDKAIARLRAHEASADLAEQHPLATAMVVAGAGTGAGSVLGPNLHDLIQLSRGK